MRTGSSTADICDGWAVSPRQLGAVCGGRLQPELRRREGVNFGERRGRKMSGLKASLIAAFSLN